MDAKLGSRRARKSDAKKVLSWKVLGGGGGQIARARLMAGHEQGGDLVTARRTRRAEVPPLNIQQSILDEILNFQNFQFFMIFAL